MPDGWFASAWRSGLGSGAVWAASVEQARDAVMDVVRHHFSPEFLNRLDEIVLFNRLSRESMGPIVDLQMKGFSLLFFFFFLLQSFSHKKKGQTTGLSHMLADRRISVSLDPSARDYLCLVGYDPVFGARPVRRGRVRQQPAWRRPRYRWSHPSW